ncbi:hypothetical protein [Azoarcus sp. KH32C]|uniref:hypothetical protein n=1 Tax=Azoarcus sp. KH32C TaxID=748247 RepID=UPI0002385D9B|nr:hypothetical protein [Azoarcus sp. KH32C]BAL27083.1 hypothetical protein AZKH_p0200 [Azoarcus sp. KH32C]
MFDAPRMNEFTQGTIFSCAYAENYKGGKVYGLVITARCDAAQEKTPVFTYVPVVPLAVWLLVDGASIVLDRVEADISNTLRNYLKDANLSQTLLKTHSEQAIYDAHFRPHEEERARKSQCDKFRKCIQQIDETRGFKADCSDWGRLKNYLTQNQAKTDAVIKELASHRLNGYYLLRNLETYSDENGDYVVLLREIHHIPSDVAKLIAGGLPFDVWKEAYSNCGSICPRILNEDDMALPVGKLKSPWIEHLMQNFALLFSRIGVKDNDFDDIKKCLMKKF